MIETLTFGRTGHESTRTIFGAAALGSVSQDVANRTLDLLLEYGINHIDVAASYGDAELRIGPWMDEYRDRFFLATKTGVRDRAGAREEIRRSLDRLRVDHVDLIQLHNLVDPIEWDQAMGPDGALEACVEAREEGLVRFIGVTGHGVAIPGMHLRSLTRFDFDSVLMPYNWPMMQNPYYVEQFEVVAALCRQRNAAIQTIKSLARRPWGEQQPTTSTWYAPFTDPEDIKNAVSWVLSRPGIFLNTASDVDLLPMVLEAAAGFTAGRSPEAEARALAALNPEPLFV